MTGSHLLPVILQKPASESEQVVPSFGLSSADPPHNGQCDASPLKSGRGRDGAAIYATGQEWQPRQRPGPLVNVLGGPMGLRAMWGSFESLGDTEL